MERVAIVTGGAGGLGLAMVRRFLEDGATVAIAAGALPRPTGFTVCAFPFKLERASAAWSRAVAIFEE